MKRVLLFIGCCWLVIGFAAAQRLVVESMTTVVNDISASQYRRNDYNGDPCALIKVSLAAKDAQFEGSVIPPVEYKMGEYWVYMSKGSQELRIKHPSFVPLHVKFADYGIGKDVQPLQTYALTLLIPQLSGIEVDDGMRYFVMSVEPANATVYIDDQPQVVQNGTISILLPMGEHRYMVESTAYESKSGTFTIGNEKLSLPIKLQSNMATLNIGSTTQGTQIYVNDQLRGSSSWSGTLPAGTYRIEGRLKGYRNHRQNIQLSQRENKQVTIPALQTITGTINVNYMPADAEVWLDGKKIGSTPDIFRNIPIGEHSIELRKSGYNGKTISVNIEDNKTASIAGALDKKQQSVTDNSSLSDSSNNQFSSNLTLGSPTNPTIQYLFTHPMLFLDPEDIKLSRSQMEKKLARLHGSEWRIDKTKSITYLRPDGKVMVDGRIIDYIYCSYWDDNFMRTSQIVINDRKYSSYSEAKSMTDHLISKIRAMGFTVKEEFRNKDLHYTGSNGDIDYEVRLPQDYPGQLYIELIYKSSTAVSSLNAVVSSSLRSNNNLSKPSNNRSSLSSEISKFFPYDGIVFGETKVSDLSRLGYKNLHSDYSNSDYYIGSSGINVYDNNNDQYVDYIVTSSNDALPSAWTNIGFDWGLSYNQCMTLVKRLGFVVKTTIEPHAEQFSGRKTLRATFEATSPNNLMSIEFVFEFGNEHGEGYSVDSRNSLEFLHIKYLGE